MLTVNQFPAPLKVTLLIIFDKNDSRIGVNTYFSSVLLLNRPVFNPTFRRLKTNAESANATIWKPVYRQTASANQPEKFF